MVASPRSEVSPGNNGARDAPTIGSNTVDDGILTHFSSWTNISSSPWTAAPHKPSDLPSGSPREATPTGQILAPRMKTVKGGGGHNAA
jgi:hypothetical protein